VVGITADEAVPVVVPQLVSESRRVGHDDPRSDPSAEVDDSQRLAVRPTDYPVRIHC